jgi:hypothetical protein
LKRSSIQRHIDGSFLQTAQTALAGKIQPGAEQRLATTVEAHVNRFASCSIIPLRKSISSLAYEVCHNLATKQQRFSLFPSDFVNFQIINFKNKMMLEFLVGHILQKYVTLVDF